MQGVARDDSRFCCRTSRTTSLRSPSSALRPRASAPFLRRLTLCGRLTLFFMLQGGIGSIDGGRADCRAAKPALREWLPAPPLCSTLSSTDASPCSELPFTSGASDPATTRCSRALMLQRSFRLSPSVHSPQRLPASGPAAALPLEGRLSRSSSVWAGQIAQARTIRKEARSSTRAVMKKRRTRPLE